MACGTDWKKAVRGLGADYNITRMTFKNHGCCGHTFAPIDGILHLFGPATGGIGSTIRNYFDVPVINGLIGDGSANATWWFGKNLRPIQTGRIQQYLILSFVVLFIIGGALYFFWLA